METATSIFKGKVSLSPHETTDTFIYILSENNKDKD